MSGRRITRRNALALGGVTALAGLGGAAVVAVRRIDGELIDGNAVRPYKSPELATNLPSGFTRIADAFEGREFAPGQPVDWPEGIFFLQQDGRVEAIRAQTNLAFRWPIPPGTPPNFGWSPGPWDDPTYVAPVATYESLCDGEIIRAEVFHHRDKTKQFAFLHRDSGVAFTIDEPDLMLWPAGPYLVMVSTAQLDYNNPLKRPDGFIPLGFKVLDGGLNVVSEGTMLTSAQRGRPSENSLAYDSRSGCLYYFEPADDWKRLVRLNVRGNGKPEDVLQLPIMSQARDVSGTTSNWDLWPAPDERTAIGIDRTTQSAWLIREGTPVTRARGIYDQGHFPLLSPTGEHAASQEYLRGIPAVVIREAPGGAPVLRIRSAIIDTYVPRWLDETTVVINVLHADWSGLGFDLRDSTASLERLPIRDATGTPGFGRSPSPHTPGLIATGLASMELPDGQLVQARVEASLLERLKAERTLAPITPWSARPHELPFTFPSLPGLWDEARGTYGNRAFLPPAVEFAPYTDDAIFTATQSYDLRDGAFDEAATVAHIDAGERLELVPNPREEWPKMELAEWGERPGITWAHVAASPTRYGWIPVTLLRWAAGTPL